MSLMSERISRLEALDACALSDALDSLGIAGAVDGLFRRSTRKRIAGRVQTLRLSSSPPEGGSRQHLGTRSIEAATTTDIIVVEQRTGVGCACWGGVLANAALKKGVRGVIAEGPVRDVDEYEEIGFPVFARSTTPVTARGRIYEQSVNETIRVGEIDVAPGDYVIADGSGVVFVPETAVDEVIESAESIAEKERLMTRDVHAGVPVTRIMGTDYETMLGTQD